MSCYALIVAAGIGARMGLGKNKVFASVCGHPVLWHTVHAFDGLTDGLCIVVRPEEESLVRAIAPDALIAYGGETRQDSVLNGLMSLPPDADTVLIHDAARPLITADVILRCRESAEKYGSGIAAVPVKDTIRQVDENGEVVCTPNRSSLRAIQTPQAFRLAPLLDAIKALNARGIKATDDASAIESSGKQVRLVEGNVENIKLTTPEDLLLAELILKKRGFEK